MEKICKDLREHVMRTVKYEKKEITPLTDEEDNSKRIMKSKKFATYVKKNLILMMMTIKSIIRSEIIIITLENLEELLTIFVI